MKTSKIFLFVLFLLITYYLPAQDIQSLVQQGMNKAYNMELDAAEKIFNKIIDKYPDHPYGYYHIAQLHFWLYLGTRDPGEYQVFFKFAEFAEEKIEKLLDKEPENYRLEYVAGNLASYKAMAHATNDASVDAFWASKKAVNHFERTLELNPKFYNAYLGLGLFDYAMSFVPDFLKWAVNLTGLPSDKERGLKFIRKAYTKGTEITEAGFHLSKIYTDYLADYDSSYIYSRVIIAKHPKNTLFHYQYAVSLIKDKKLDQANDVLNTVLRLDNKKIPQITALAHFRKGEIFFKKNQFNSAIRQFEKFLDTSRELDLTGIASYYTAISYRFLDNKIECEKYLTLARGGNQDIFEDSYAKEKSELYTQTEITPIDLKLIKIKNYLDSGRYKTAYDSLSALQSVDLNNNQEMMVYTFLGEAALHLKKYDEAITILEQNLDREPVNDKWLIPQSFLLMAQSEYALGHYEDAKRYLDEAEDENSYEYKDFIQSLIESLKRQIGNK